MVPRVIASSFIVLHTILPLWNKSNQSCRSSLHRDILDQNSNQELLDGGLRQGGVGRAESSGVLAYVTSVVPSAHFHPRLYHP